MMINFVVNKSKTRLRFVTQITAQPGTNWLKDISNWINKNPAITTLILFNFRLYHNDNVKRGGNESYRTRCDEQKCAPSVSYRVSYSWDNGKFYCKQIGKTISTLNFKTVSLD